MKLEPGIGSPPMPTGGLAQTGIGGLFHRFIGQGTGAGNDAHFARQVDVARHDADFALAWGDHARAVRPDHAHAGFVQLHFHGQHVQGRDAFGDGDDQFDAGIDRFQDGVFAERRWNVDDRGRGAGRFNRFAHGVEHRQAQVLSAAFARGYAANHFGAVSDSLFGVESPWLPVKPWQITLVFLSIKMDIIYPPLLQQLAEPHQSGWSQQ